MEGYTVLNFIAFGDSEIETLRFLNTIYFRFVTSARQLAKALEVPLVNDLGYTKRYVRCLQVILLAFGRVNHFGRNAIFHSMLFILYKVLWRFFNEILAVYSHKLFLHFSS